MGRLALWVPLLLAGCSGWAPASPGSRPAQDTPAAAQPTAEPASLTAASVSPTAPPPAEDEEPPAVSHDDEVEDDADLESLEEDEAPEQQVVVHPLSDWSDERIGRAVADDLGSLGPMSLGAPSSGALINAVPMPTSEWWELVDAHHAWGTQETIDYLRAAIERVHREFPGSPKLYIGHISARHGGHLRPHISHQAGRDVDISFFYKNPNIGWYARAHAGNLDTARTWAFIKALVEETDVEMILMDHSLHKPVRDHALELGEDPTWVAQLFQGQSGKLRPIIRHAPGHATHLHIRFYSPIAQETGRRAYSHLLKHKKVKPPTYYVQHKVKRGETLIHLARRYGTSVKAIQAANGLRSTKIQARKVYRIPRAGGAAPPGAKNPLVIPVRRKAPRVRPSRGEPVAAR